MKFDLKNISQTLGLGKSIVYDDVTLLMCIIRECDLLMKDKNHTKLGRTKLGADGSLDPLGVSIDKRTYLR